VIETDAVFAPPVVGVKVTLMVQLAPPANVAPHVVVRAKSLAFVPVSVMPLIAMDAPPVFDRVMLRALLVVFTAWLPKATEVGERLTTGIAPVPESDTL
jgi:hypothetical protein